MEQPDYLFDESDIVGVPMPPPKAPKAKKADKRSTSSKANIVKAIEAKKRQKEEEYEIEELSESSDSEEEYVPVRKAKGKKKKTQLNVSPEQVVNPRQQNLYTEQQMNELRHIVSALAKAQKKSAKQKKKTIIQVPQQPAPQAPPAEKKDPAKDMLKNNILRF